MRLDVTLQRQSKIINGFKVVLVASFFVAIALAVGGLCEHSLDGSETPGLETSDIPEPGNEHIVPVAPRYSLGPFDTEPGEIKLINYNFPYINPDGTLNPLPLCITNDMAQTWWWELEITGGYEPEPTDPYWSWMGIGVYQDQDKNGNPELIQGWNIEWTPQNPDDPCCVPKRWIGSPSWCGNVVCLQSNQYPVLSGGLEYFMSEHYPYGPDGAQLTEIPGKDVYIEFGLLYSGCPLDEQEFAYILAQKRCNFPNFPQLPS